MRAKIKKFFGKIKNKIKETCGKIHSKFRKKFPKKEPKYYDGELHQNKYLLKLCKTAFFIYLYIETYARIKTGIFDGIIFIFQHPLVFIYNWFLIFTTLLLVLLFKKRGFALLVISAVWVVLGTVNGTILLKRMTPFTLYDAQNLGDGLTILTTYYSHLQIVLGLAAIILTVAIAAIYYVSCSKWKNINYRKSLLTVIAAFIICLISTAGLIKTGTLDTFFGNLNYAYRDYGFPYCFINTSVNKGISRPQNYSEEDMMRILEEHTSTGGIQEPEKIDDNQEHPNVIILQLESFTVADDYKNIKVSKDPTPVFSKLSKEYTSGRFEVPACGAGTANTEFEVLTGISARFFGPGEYPYKGNLRETPLESMAYILKNSGYSTSALHDHRALFYNRNEVYPNLGFDNFTSVEYMNNITKTPTNWVKDEVLQPEITDIIKSTDTRDFLHVISVEGHGAYPTEQVFKNPYTEVTADDEETKWKYEYYFNECYEMDKFTGNLLKELEEIDEPTVVLIYGDHIPAIDVKEEDYGDGNLYETRYVLWDNMGLQKMDEDINSYEIGARILEKIGLGGKGAIFDYEQTVDKHEDYYLDELKSIAYDMMYGNNFVFGGKNPYKATKMTMGHKKIKIKDIVKVGDEYYIRGENFTEHSSVSLDGEVLKTVYLNPNLLGLQEKVDKEDVSKLEVSQIDTKDDTVLSTINSLEEL